MRVSYGRPGVGPAGFYCDYRLAHRSGAQGRALEPLVILKAFNIDQDSVRIRIID